jgi:4'-phosphopantetheinyl transferase
LGDELISPSVALREGEVHLWRASLSVDADTLAVLSRTLSADEHERGHRFHFERDRVRWMTGRGWLRQLLAGYLDADPAELCFDQHVFGKPRLAAPAPWLRFNVSHAEDIASFAVAHSREVGVDIERIREEVLGDRAERRFLSEREQAAIAGLPYELRLRAIFQCWTVKEAYLKASGLGLQVSMADLDVCVLPDGRTRLNDRSAAAESGRWSVYAFDAGHDSTGAVAAEGSGMRIPVVPRWL